MAEANAKPRRGRRRLWRNMQAVFEIPEARIVAVIHDGGAMVETRNIVFREGRVPMLNGTNSDRSSELQYVSGFGEPGNDDPEAGIFNIARIIVAGNHAVGHIEIRGDGWIGFDECGLLGGWFDTPPVIVIDAADCSRPPREAEPDAKIDIMKMIEEPAKPIDPQPSSEYLAAVRGIELERK